MNLRARRGVALLWAALLGWSLLPRLAALWPSLAALRHGVLVDGDQEFDEAMVRVAALAGTEPAVFLVLAASVEEHTYLEYRAQFDLYPVHAIVAFDARGWVEPGAWRGARVRVAAAWDRVRGLRRLRLRANGREAVRIVEAGEPMPPPVAASPASWSRWWAAVLALLGAVRFGWVRLRGPVRTPAVGLGRADRLGVAAVVLALGLAVAGALAPQSAWSTWDAWAVWDLKMKAILHEGLIPRAVLTDPAYGFAHPEYPLLWPWLKAALCRAAGGIDPGMLRLTSVLFAAAMPPLLAALLGELGVMQGRWVIAGGVALLPPVLTQSANGYVDWPLAVVETATLLLLVRALRRASSLVAVGVMAGLAANLKQEGLVFGLAVIAVLGWGVRADRAARRAWGGAMLVWLLLALPWQATAWRLALHPADFGSSPGRMLATVPGRLGLFVRAFGLEAFGPGLGGASFGAGTPIPWQEWTEHLRNGWLLFWFAAAWILVRRWRGLGEPVRRELSIVLMVQVAMAVGAYGATVLDPRWLLAASLDRLMLQWVPLVAALAASLALAERKA